MHDAKPAFAHTSGPRDAKVVLVGEAFGENEDILKVPFVGWSGYELSKMLFEAGLCMEPPLAPTAYSSTMLADWWRRQDVLLTNVLAFRPPNNKISALCADRKTVGADYWRQPIEKGLYLLPEYLPELERLRAELRAWPRHCIIALGAKATWALMNQPGIVKVRGVATSASALCPELKVVPTYHPAGILRNWTWRAIAVADLIKVSTREGTFPEIQRPEREVLINPHLQDVRDFFKRPVISWGVDVETFRGQVSMVGFAPSQGYALCVPLIDRRKPGWSYWSPHEEREIYGIMKRALESDVPKVGQNFLYDLQYFIRSLRIRPRACVDDTMLLQHSLMPEQQKSLGFLGSIHTNEASWKLFRSREQEELKRDE